MRESAALWLPAERPAQVDDRVTVDLKLTAGEKVVSNLHDNEFELTTERPGVFAGMDDHIVGMREGERAEFTTTIPEDYANPDLAGKEAQYEVEVKAVKTRELPELDDEFAKTQGDYETLDGLRETIREEMVQRKEADARRDLRETVLNELVGDSKIEIHSSLVEEEQDTMIRETTRMLEQSRLNFQQYLQIMGKSQEEYRDEIEPEATARVKRDLALTAVADAEGIEVTDEEIQNWLDVFTAVGGKPMQLRDAQPRTARQRDQSHPSRQGAGATGGDRHTGSAGPGTGGERRESRRYRRRCGQRRRRAKRTRRRQRRNRERSAPRKRYQPRAINRRRSEASRYNTRAALAERTSATTRQS